MKNVFIINAHEYYAFSEGTLILSRKGYEIRTTGMQGEYEVKAETEKHLWADTVSVQGLCNWMGVPWSFKRYMDPVCAAGVMGQLCDGDDRTCSGLTTQYGTSGLLNDKHYMFSLTFNAPKTAFDDPDQRFSAGKSVGDLFRPMHLNFRFFGMQPVETLVYHDVLKNPNIEDDLLHFGAHLEKHF